PKSKHTITKRFINRVPRLAHAPYLRPRLKPARWSARSHHFPPSVDVLSDGSFKPLAYSCVQTERQTGCVMRATYPACFLRSPRIFRCAGLDELPERGVFSRALRRTM